MLQETLPGGITVEWQARTVLYQLELLEWRDVCREQSKVMSILINWMITTPLWQESPCWYVATLQPWWVRTASAG